MPHTDGRYGLPRNALRAKGVKQPNPTMENTKGECDCYTRSDRFKISIVFCPLHKSAPDLYEALEKLLNATQKLHPAFAHDGVCKDAEQALAKAGDK